MKHRIRMTMAMLFGSFVLPGSYAQVIPAPTDWQRIFRMAAVSGYEKSLTEAIRSKLREYSPRTDNLGNVYITIGSGAPHRLIATSIDEPGYVVSGITEGGYLRVQRQPQRDPDPVLDRLYFTQPVTIETRAGPPVTGIFVGMPEVSRGDLLSQSNTLEKHELYVDIGARSEEEAHKAGINASDPVAPARQWFPVGRTGEAGPAVGDRFGALALAQMLEEVKNFDGKGSTTVAFLTQHWLGNHGLDEIVVETEPDELIYIGRLDPGITSKTISETVRPGSGVILRCPKAVSGSGCSFGNELRLVAQNEQIPVQIAPSKSPAMARYLNFPSFPKRWAVLSVPTLWPATPGEFVAWKDVEHLAKLLSAYLGLPKTKSPSSDNLVIRRGYRKSEDLIGNYGVSGHEADVREIVLSRLDYRLRDLTRTDKAGNLILHLGDGKGGGKIPKLVFVAHMDEIGYEVSKVEKDGRIRIEALGGWHPEYSIDQLVLVHKDEGRPVGGVLEPSTDWAQAGAREQKGLSANKIPLHVFVGTKSREETQQLGIEAGDFVTIRKEYRRLLGTYAIAPSFDDRVGCSALINAANAIGKDLPGRDVTFVWSTKKEAGSIGAKTFVHEAFEQGRVPDFVFVVDAFAVSESPLDAERSSGVELGRGFVVLSPDGLNIGEKRYTERIVQLSGEAKLHLQYGAADNKDEGTIFMQYNIVSIPLGWPIRNVHTPIEMIDIKDFEALAKMIETIVRRW